MADPLFGLATLYRIAFSILGSWVVARLAPRRPMKHAMIAGVIGLVVSVAGAAATWNRDLGPHWYNVAVAGMALPCAWMGGKIREGQLANQAAA